MKKIIIPNQLVSCTTKKHQLTKTKGIAIGDTVSLCFWSNESGKRKLLHLAQVVVEKIWDISFVTADDDGEHDYTYFDFMGKQTTWFADEYMENSLIKRVATNEGFDSVSDFCEIYSKNRTRKMRDDYENATASYQVICWDKDVNYEWAIENKFNTDAAI